MPGTMTRLNRVRDSTGSLRLADRGSRSDGGLKDKHVALVGVDTSAHVTGFAGFTGSLSEWLTERAGRVSRPLDAGLVGVPDLVVAVLPGPGAAAAAAELAEQHGVPLLVVAQGETRPLVESATTTGAHLAARLEARARHRADRWAVTGQAVRDRLIDQGVPADRIETLPYWAAPTGSRPLAAAEQAAARRTLDLPGGFVVVCPVGADTSGLVAVVGAAHVLAASGSDVQVVLTGRGPRLRALAASAFNAANVTVIETDDAGHQAGLIAADLVLLSEAADRPDGANAGRLAAALGAGRPIIAAVADDGHLRAELARAEAAVITVPLDRPQQLAHAIDVLAGSPQARAMMAAGARHYTRAHLTTDAAATTLEAIAGRTQRPATSGSSRWGQRR
jgi:glycosyltransferase involved in cell wall biosynthesis